MTSLWHCFFCCNFCKSSTGDVRVVFIHQVTPLFHITDENTLNRCVQDKILHKYANIITKKLHFLGPPSRLIVNGHVSLLICFLQDHCILPSYSSSWYACILGSSRFVAWSWFWVFCFKDWYFYSCVFYHGSFSLNGRSKWYLTLICSLLLINSSSGFILVRPHSFDCFWVVMGKSESRLQLRSVNIRQLLHLWFVIAI